MKWPINERIIDTDSSGQLSALALTCCTEGLEEEERALVVVWGEPNVAPQCMECALIVSVQQHRVIYSVMR